MAYLSNALTSEHLSTDGVQGLHYELISKVGLSDAIELPTPAELRSLPLLPNTTLPNDYDRTPGKFVFANPARTYPIVYNNKEGMLVGKSENGDRIWAHIHRAYGNKVLCDRPQRAFILFQAVSSGGVVQCLSSLEQVNEWDGYIAGECEGLVPRWRFVYDSLVQELQAEAE